MMHRIFDNNGKLLRFQFISSHNYDGIEDIKELIEKDEREGYEKIESLGLTDEIPPSPPITEIAVREDFPACTYIPKELRESINKGRCILIFYRRGEPVQYLDWDNSYVVYDKVLKKPVHYFESKY